MVSMVTLLFKSIPILPEVVIGLPVIIKLLSLLVVKPTEVTVPPASSITQLVFPFPSVESICPGVP